MVSFNVAEMSLRGPITGRFAGWSKVLSINLQGNAFTGPLPPNIGQEIPEIFSLLLSENQFDGEIPPSVGNLLNMRNLRLAGNQLGGSIVPELGNLPSLCKSLYA